MAYIFRRVEREQINCLGLFPRYDEKGFIVDGVEISGAVICFGNSTFRWNASDMADITPESLAIFEAIRPVPGKKPVLKRLICLFSSLLWELDARVKRPTSLAIKSMPSKAAARKLVVLKQPTGSVSGLLRFSEGDSAFRGNLSSATDRTTLQSWMLAHQWRAIR
jgi:uncharacterized protein